jgi:hypothetical protein
MKRRPLLLLCVAFLLAQFAALLHVTQHELAPEGSADCEICAVAHVSAPPTPTFVSPTLPSYVESIVRVALHAIVTKFFHARPPATGPPAARV